MGRLSSGRPKPTEVDDASALTALIYTLERDLLNREAVERIVEGVAPGGRKGRLFEFTNPDRAKWAQGLADKLS